MIYLILTPSEIHDKIDLYNGHYTHDKFQSASNRLKACFKAILEDIFDRYLCLCAVENDHVVKVFTVDEVKKLLLLL